MARRRMRFNSAPGARWPVAQEGARGFDPRLFGSTPEQAARRPFRPEAKSPLSQSGNPGALPGRATRRGRGGTEYAASLNLAAHGHAGSKPVGRTKFVPLAQLVEASRLGREGFPFESEEGYGGCWGWLPELS